MINKIKLKNISFFLLAVSILMQYISINFAQSYLIIYFLISIFFLMKINYLPLLINNERLITFLVIWHLFFSMVLLLNFIFHFLEKYDLDYFRLIGYNLYTLTPFFLLGIYYFFQKKINLIEHNKLVQWVYTVIIISSMIPILSQVGILDIEFPKTGQFWFYGLTIWRNSALSQIESTSLAFILLYLYIMVQYVFGGFLSKTLVSLMLVILIISTVSKPALFILLLILIIQYNFLIILGVVIFFSQLEQLYKVIETLSLDSFLERITQWKSNFTFLEENLLQFLFGMGFKAKNILLNQYPHSQILDAMTNYGLLFFIFYIILLFLITYNRFKPLDCISTKKYKLTVYVFISGIYLTFITTEMYSNLFFVSFVILVVPIINYQITANNKYKLNNKEKK